MANIAEGSSFKDGKKIAKTSRDDHWPSWNDIPDKPSNFTPSVHKSTHASGGSDVLTPADIGAAPASHTHTKSNITDFAHTHNTSDINNFSETVQDTIGAILTDTTTIDFTYDDINNQIKADVKSNSSNQKVAVSKNSTAPTGTRKQINFKDGTNISITVADNATNDAVDVTIANTYTHPTGDGNLHVPTTGTSNNNKVLKAGASAGSISWGNVDWSELTNKPSSSVANIDSAVTNSHTHSNKALLDTYTQTEVNLADAVSKKHTQNTDTMLTGSGANVINTTGTGNIVDFKVNSAIKSSIDNTGKFTGTVDWNNINGKPSTYTPSTHTHNGSDITSAVTQANNADTLDGYHANSFRLVQSKYVTTTEATEGYYRVASIPMTAQFKNTIFKVKAYTATGTITESTIIIDVAYYAGSYSSQTTGISAVTSHSYNSETNAENGWVLRYCRVSFDVNYGYIDLYKYKTTAVTIEIEPLVESDWVWATGSLTVNPIVGSYRNTSVTLSAGFRANSLYADSATYSNYGTLGTQTLSNTTDKTGQWAYFGNWYFEYNSSYLRGRSGNIRIRIQEINHDGTKNLADLDDFVLNIRVGLAYHADSTAFNNTIPTIYMDIEGKTSLAENDIVALVYSTSTSNKYIRFYIKLKEPNTIYCINPEQRYGRSFATSTYSQTSSYCYFNYAGDQTPVTTLPTPAQGSLVYAVKRTIDADSVNGKNVDDTKTDSTVLWTASKIISYVGSAGYGDMVRAVYDANDDGIVDNADKLDGYHAGNASGNIPISNGTLNTNLNADMLDGKHASDFALNSHPHDIISYKDTRSINFAPFDYKGISFHLKYNTTDGLVDGGTYHGILHLTQWSDSSGGKVHQLAFTDGGNIYFRQHNGSSWTSWNKLYHSGNDGDGSGLDADKVKGKNIFISSTQPSNPQVGDIWIDIS